LNKHSIKILEYVQADKGFDHKGDYAQQQDKYTLSTGLATAVSVFKKKKNSCSGIGTKGYLDSYFLEYSVKKYCIHKIPNYFFHLYA